MPYVNKPAGDFLDVFPMAYSDELAWWLLDDLEIHRSYVNRQAVVEANELQAKEGV